MSRENGHNWSSWVYKTQVIHGALAKKVQITDYARRSVCAVFPFTFPSWNVIQSLHWAVRKKWHDQFQKAAVPILLGLQCKPFGVPVKILIDIYFKNKRTRDLDNYGGKWLIDAIRMAGIIPDDSAEWIPAPPDVLIVNGEKKDQIVLQIKEI